MKFRLPGRPLERLMEHSVENLTRFACVAALVGLFVMMASVVFPNPLLIIFATSGGQLIGGFAVLCYFLAVILDVKRNRRSSLPPAPKSASSASPNAR
jgi:hypothetical protein